MIGLFPPSAGRIVKLELPYEVGGLFEMRSHCKDLVNDVLNTDDIEFPCNHKQWTSSYWKIPSPTTGRTNRGETNGQPPFQLSFQKKANLQTPFSAKHTRMVWKSPHLTKIFKSPSQTNPVALKQKQAFLPGQIPTYKKVWTRKYYDSIYITRKNLWRKTKVVSRVPSFCLLKPLNQDQNLQDRMVAAWLWGRSLN